MVSVFPKKVFLPLVLAFVLLISLSGGSLKALTSSVMHLQHNIGSWHTTNPPGCPPPPYDCW